MGGLGHEEPLEPNPWFLLLSVFLYLYLKMEMDMEMEMEMEKGEKLYGYELMEKFGKSLLPLLNFV